MKYLVAHIVCFQVRRFFVSMVHIFMKQNVSRLRWRMTKLDTTFIILVGTKGRVICYSVFVNEQARVNKESLITTVFSGATHLEAFICFLN